MKFVEVANFNKNNLLCICVIMSNLRPLRAIMIILFKIQLIISCDVMCSQQDCDYDQFANDRFMLSWNWTLQCEEVFTSTDGWPNIFLYPSLLWKPKQYNQFGGQ